MRSPKIQKLVNAVETVHGVLKVFGSEVSEEHGTCFILDGLDATFSVHTQDGSLPSDEYDVQIEGTPPGDYIYTAIVSLNTFLELVSLMHGPEDQWPMMERETS